MMENNEQVEQLLNKIDTSIERSVKRNLAENHPQEAYETIEEYTQKTGKRFRVTKDQKSRNLTREEAFVETFKS